MVVVSVCPEWPGNSRTIEVGVPVSFSEEDINNDSLQPPDTRCLVILGAIPPLANMHHLTFAIAASWRTQNPFLKAGKIVTWRAGRTKEVFARRGSLP